MNVSVKREKQLAEQAAAQIDAEFGNRTLHRDHPLSQRVTSVVRRLVEANGLGSIKGEHAPSQSLDGSMVDGLLDHPDPRLRIDVSGQSQNISHATQKTEWNVRVVVDDKTPNAFATFGSSLSHGEVHALVDPNAGGNVVVFTGILPICEDDEGLAAVIGHGTPFSTSQFFSHTWMFRDGTCW
jgi:predicted Zn-dependent protease